MLMRDLNEYLNEIFALHHLCLRVDHGIQYGNRPWKLFVPSKFVYSFFTFNTIYSTDWSASFELGEVTEWKCEKGSNGELKDPSESKKIRGYVDFLYKNIPGNFVEVLDEQLRKGLNGMDDTLSALEGIKIDKRIDQKKSESFQRYFRLLWEQKVKGKNHKEAVRKIAHFVYLVRNNIFHGQKNTLQMMESTQQERLKIYTAFLASLNYLLFVVAEDKIGWTAPEIKVGPHKLSSPVPWEILFVWSGFEFTKNGNEFLFERESTSNKEYLEAILQEIECDGCFDGISFKPAKVRRDKWCWLNALEKLHGGAEGVSPEDLKIMDPYIGGVIRSLNKLGFKTRLSCDGHGKRRHRIQLAEPGQSYLLDACLRIISKGRYGFDKSSIIQLNKEGIKHDKGSGFSRQHLLEAAGLIYYNKEKIENIVEQFGHAK
jgi:hypothetical protein